MNVSDDECSIVIAYVVDKLGVFPSDCNLI